MRPRPALSVDAVAFDLDGVLVDSEPANVRSAFDAFAAFGAKLHPSDVAAIVGRHPADYVPLLARRFGLDAAEQARLRAHQSAIYAACWAEQAAPFAGAAELLDLLRRRGYPLALATSAGRRHATRCLEEFGFGGHFEFVLAKEDVRRLKPDPEIYRTCAQRFGIEPSRLLVVEDSEPGVGAAKAAGTRCAAVASPHVARERIAAADLVLGSLAELGPLLAR